MTSWTPRIVANNALRDQLAELGCPYDATDPRCVIFLEGAKAGARLAHTQAIKALKEGNLR